MISIKDGAIVQEIDTTRTMAAVKAVEAASILWMLVKKRNNPGDRIQHEHSGHGGSQLSTKIQ